MYSYTVVIIEYSSKSDSKWLSVWDSIGKAHRFGVGVERVPKGCHPLGDVAERGTRRGALYGRLRVAEEKRVCRHWSVREEFIFQHFIQYVYIKGMLYQRLKNLKLKLSRYINQSCEFSRTLFYLKLPYLLKFILIELLWNFKLTFTIKVKSHFWGSDESFFFLRLSFL